MGVRRRQQGKGGCECCATLLPLLISNIVSACDASTRIRRLQLQLQRAPHAAAAAA